LRKIAILNQKGGVGKTTTVVNVAAALASAGSKVAVLDLDPQAHLTIHLGMNPEIIDSGSYKVVTQSSDIAKEIVLVRPNLWLLPANINLVGAESELVSVVGRETILREAIAKIEGVFDYLIIDCAPSLGLLTLNALAAATEILIPLQPHFLALQGFGKLLQTVELVNKRINPDLKVKGILLCMFDSRASLPNEVRADIEQFLENARGTNCAWSEAKILPVYIRRNIKLAEAPGYGKTIFEYEPNCHGAEDYKKVAQIIHNPALAIEQKIQPNEQQIQPEEQQIQPPEPEIRFTEQESSSIEPEILVTETADDNAPPAIEIADENAPEAVETTDESATEAVDIETAPPCEIKEIQPPSPQNPSEGEFQQQSDSTDSAAYPS